MLRSTSLPGSCSAFSSAFLMVAVRFGADGLAVRFQHDEGVEHVVVARIHDLGVVDAEGSLIQYRGHGGKDWGIAAIDEHLATAPYGMLADEHQGAGLSPWAMILRQCQAICSGLWRRGVIGLEVVPEGGDRLCGTSRWVRICLAWRWFSGS